MCSPHFKLKKSCLRKVRLFLGPVINETIRAGTPGFSESEILGVTVPDAPQMQSHQSSLLLHCVKSSSHYGEFSIWAHYVSYGRLRFQFLCTVDAIFSQLLAERTLIERTEERACGAQPRWLSMEMRRTHPVLLEGTIVTAVTSDLLPWLQGHISEGDKSRVPGKFSTRTE